MKEEVLVCFDDFFQVFFADRLFTRYIFLFQAFLQHLGRGLEIDHEVRRGQLVAKIIVVAVVGIEFLIIQVEICKQLVFFEDEIRDHEFLRARTEIQRAKLLEPLDQKRELRLESSAGLSLIKRSQEGVVLRVSNSLGIEPLGEDGRQRAFADAYGTFYRNIPREIEKLGHEYEEIGSENIPNAILAQLRNKLTAD